MKFQTGTVHKLEIYLETRHCSTYRSSQHMGGRGRGSEGQYDSGKANRKAQAVKQGQESPEVSFLTQDQFSG